MIRTLALPLAIAATLTTLPAAAQTTQPSPAVTEAAVAGLFDRWNASLATLDSDAVVANYAEDAVLLPTVSNQPRFTQAEREDYFDHFLEGHPQGEILERRIQLGCGMAVDSGLYRFTFSDGRQVTARYSYAYRHNDGEWLIVSHHSSALPESE